MDLDRFKELNDSCGHSYGDQILIKAANCIREVSGEDAILGRFGGDEFVFFLPGKGEEEAKQYAKSLLETLYRQIKVPMKERGLCASVGIALCPPDLGKNYDVLLKRADRALYATKEQGRAGYTVYSRNEMTRQEVKLKGESWRTVNF